MTESGNEPELGKVQWWRCLICGKEIRVAEGVHTNMEPGRLRALLQDEGCTRCGSSRLEQMDDPPGDDAPEDVSA